MLTLEGLVSRYNSMSLMTPERFEILQADAIIIMGTAEFRWAGMYDMAMAALIAHYSETWDKLLPDDSALSNMPVSRTDVDDVQVEFAQNMLTKVPYVEADLFSTSYGQAYMRYRRMAFAGPRVA